MAVASLSIALLGTFGIPRTCSRSHVWPLPFLARKRCLLHDGCIPLPGYTPSGLESERSDVVP